MKRLEISKALLLVCDVQEVFRHRIHQANVLIPRCAFANNSCILLDIPRIFTLQYPKALGQTVIELNTESSLNSPAHLFSKTKFSMLTDEVIKTIQSYENKTQILICGIEAHVCISQTVLDLLEVGADVFVLADAVSSQRLYDRNVALERLKSAGAVITTVESAIFELLKTSDHPKFKTYSNLLKNSNLPNWENLPY